jgi:hypothetical protein
MPFSYSTNYYRATNYEWQPFTVFNWTEVALELPVAVQSPSSLTHVVTVLVAVK